MGLWTLIKGLSWQLKIGVAAGLLLALASLVGSAYYIGYSKGENLSKVAISQYEGKVKDLSAQLATKQSKTDVKIVTEYVTKTEYITRVQYKNRDIVIERVPEQFNLSKGWVYAYNNSILGLELDPIKASDPTPSSVSEMRALADTIIPNNGKYLTTAENLRALQKWVTETKANSEKVNEK